LAPGIATSWSPAVGAAESDDQKMSTGGACPLGPLAITARPPVRLGNEAVTSECGEWRVSVVPRVEPLLLPPFHRFGLGDVEIRIDVLPILDMDNHAPTSQNGGRSPCRPRIGS
jgi:hypothetical protein